MNEASTFNADGAQHSPDMHWPDGFHPEQADMFAHNEIVVRASCEKVFANIVDARTVAILVPELAECKSAERNRRQASRGCKVLMGHLRRHIESIIHEFVPGSRIRWFGNGTGMNAYHTFLLIKTDEGCHIVTEEVVKGPRSRRIQENQPNALYDGHDLWLRSLKQRSEQ
jgi:hypothetical protein